MPIPFVVQHPIIFQQWQDLQPIDLPPRKEVSERKAARRLAQRQKLEVRLLAQVRTQVVLDGLRTIKRELTFNRWTEMLQVARNLKADVHNLRVSVRAQNMHNGARPLPARAAQYRGVRVPVDALAWVNALDAYMVHIGQEPGPLIALWNMQCCVMPLPAYTQQAEDSLLATSRQDRLLLEAQPQVSGTSLRQAQVRKHMLFHQGLLLDEIMTRVEPTSNSYDTLYDHSNFASATQAVGRLRVAILAYEHPTTPLPPHPEQYALAGNSWAINRRHWRHAIREWLGQVDEDTPPAYEPCDWALPRYQMTIDAAPPYRWHWRTRPSPWLLWPKRFLRRSLSV